MIRELNSVHKDRYAGFCDFVNRQVKPYAGQWDLDQAMPAEVIEAVGREGYLGAIMPEKHGGLGWDYVTFGLLNEALGRGSSSLTVLLTVQNMVATSILKWGTERQLRRWIAPMASGNVVAAFALTEPNVGSDIQAVETKFESRGDKVILNGTKKWITFAEVADIYLVFGKQNGKSVACIVERDTPGITVTPLKEMLGFRACHLAQLDFEDVEIPAENIVGKPGFAVSHIAPVGLHYGRLSTAFSSVGLIRACLETSIRRAATRAVGQATINNISSVRNTITDIGIAYDTSLAMCLQAAIAEDERSPHSIEKTILAKYVASRHAVTAASHAVQISGAFGCHEGSSPASRYYRDAKIMEIIEGTSQVLQNVLGNYYINEHRTEAIL